MFCRKVFSILVFLCFISIHIYSFADDYIESDVYPIDMEIVASSDLSEIPTINARYAVILDRSSKTVLFGKNENEKCKMASTTKIMTAIVVIENCANLDDVVTISKKAARYRWL
jgi:D-alanyl-D-alanine carboxypeptidase